MTPDGQLEFGAGERAVELVDAVDVVLVVASDPASAAAGDIDGTPSSALAARNLFGEADRIAARAATTGTRRQYAAIYRTFAYWLREQLGRPPRVEDLDADVLVAYARHPAMGGGRGGTDRAGDRAREVLVPDAVQRALESWLKVHPLTRGVALGSVKYQRDGLMT